MKLKSRARRLPLYVEDLNRIQVAIPVIGSAEDEYLPADAATAMVLPRRVHVRLRLCTPLATRDVKGKDPCRGYLLGYATSQPDRTVVLVGEGKPLYLLV